MSKVTAAHCRSFEDGVRLGQLITQRILVYSQGRYNAGSFGMLWFPDARRKLDEIDAEIREVLSVVSQFEIYCHSCPRGNRDIT